MTKPPDIHLSAIHKGRRYERHDGLAMGPGEPSLFHDFSAKNSLIFTGPFVVALEYASGKSATVVGKPQADFFYNALPSVSHTKAALGESNDLSFCHFQWLHPSISCSHDRR